MATTMLPKVASTVIPTAIDLPNPFNPFDAIADAIRDARDLIVKGVEEYIAHPPRVSNESSLKELYQVALTPSSKYAWLVFFFAIVASILTFRAYGRVAYAFVVMLVVVTLSPSYTYLMDQLLGLGDDLAEVASSLFTSTMADSLESLGNPLFDILSFGAVILTGGIVLTCFEGTEPFYILAVFSLPLAFAVSAMGPRTRNVFNVFASIVVVLAFIGRGVAVLIIELFQGVGALRPGGQSISGQNMLTALAFTLAVVVQIILIGAVFIAIKNVQGAIASHVSSVRSRLKTSVSNVVRTRQEKSTGSKVVRPIPVVITGTVAPSKRTVVKKEVKSVAVTAAINGAALTAGAITRNPQVGAAVKKGAKEIRRKTQAT